MSENELIAGCKFGDVRIQRMLYDAYKTAMYTLAYRLTGDFDDANDVLQDTFLEVFKKIGQFRQEATLGAWIKAILVRKAKKKFNEPKSWVLVDEIPADALANDYLNERVEAEALEKHILNLPEGARMVFCLIEIEGYTHAEAAGLLGVSEGTSKSQLNYAKKKLKHWIEQNHGR